MDLKLNGKTALVTGSTAGIGLAIGIGLAREGVAVTLNGRTEARVKEALTSARDAAGPHAKIEGIALDLSTDEGAKALIGRLPKVDILVNNLGIYEPKPFAEITDADWRRFFEVNVMSGVRLSRHYLPPMLQNNWGRILFLSSESGVRIPAEMIHYGLTKTAQLALARGLAELTAGTGVTVNSVLPGPTRSEGVDIFVKRMAEAKGKSETEMEKEFFRDVRPGSLLKRFATVEEVASLAVYLSSPLAAATNGAAARAEGGLIYSAF